MLELHTGLIGWTVIIFVLLLLLLRKLAWKPILTALDERTNKIKESLTRAETAQRDAERLRAEYEATMDKARQEAQGLIAKSRKTADSARDEIMQKAQSEAEALLARAKRDISLEREKAIDEIKRTAGELSVSIAAKIIGRSLSAQDHQGLIQEALRDVQSLVGEPN